MTQSELEKSAAALRDAAERMAESLGEADPEMLQAYVEERERLLDVIRTEAAGADPSRLAALRPVIEAVLERDRLIVRRMEELRDEAAGKLQEAVQAKVQRSAYESAGPADSYFFDRKK